MIEHRIDPAKSRRPHARAELGLLTHEARVKIWVVSQAVGLAPGTIRNRVSAGTFPKPLPKEHPGANLWRWGDIVDWIERNGQGSYSW
jgi:predicted DNA-binding transcriptional regulator AlpA